MSELNLFLQQATEKGDLLEGSKQNIISLLRGSKDPFAASSVQELVDQGEWQELNDRFYKTLAFGTGGLRGRTIGKVVTSVEAGSGAAFDRPEYPCVGTAAMNFYNVGRAVQGLLLYVKKHLAAKGATRKPRLVFAHDTRHFSRDFAEYCAKVTTDLGGDAYLFEGARSTPQLSFAVREMAADAGVVLTASHNPSHDNGFKAYFDDGAQLIEPHASGVIREVNALVTEEYEALPPEEQGALTLLGEDMDEAYKTTLKTLLLQPELLVKGEKAKVVYTNIHGTGGVIIAPLLEELGFEVKTVPAQDVQDGRFPTVASPNPENGPALQMGIDLANEVNASAVIGTDPDSDRMGVAVRNASGEMQLLTGNQIGSLMAWYRLKVMFEKGWITESNRSRAVLVKTFVTTELQRAIADAFGIAVVNTLTGFKYICAKMKKYEEAIPVSKCEDYRALSAEESRALRLEFSRFYVFGGEESYGYLGSDEIRDKDGNGAAVMFAELSAYASSVNQTIPDLLDDLYKEFGVYLEKGKALVMEGADGAAKIQALAQSYSKNPPIEVDGARVLKVRDYATQDFVDEEGDEIPKEKMLFVELLDGRSFAVRPSGTEPKIKYYLYAKDEPGAPNLALSKEKVEDSIESLWAALEADAHERMS